MTTPRLDDQLCFSLYSASHAFGRAYKALLDPLGLTYPQYLVLLVLWAEDGQTVSGIGDKLHLESSTLTPLLKRMEGQGLLRRERDTADERQVRVQLTAHGRKLAHAARDVPRCMAKNIGMSLDAIGRLKRDVDQVRDSLIAPAE